MKMRRWTHGMRIRWELPCFILCIIMVVEIVLYVIRQQRFERFISFEEELSVKGPNYITLNYRNYEDGVQFVHFVEGMGHTALSKRMWCTVEAAARYNPNAEVVVHMVSSRLLMTPVADSVIRNSTNLRIVRINVENLFWHSPLRSWYKDAILLRSSSTLTFFNDVIRWLVLYYYGGILLEFDSLSVRSLTKPKFVHNTFAGLKPDGDAGSAAIAVSDKNHWLPEQCLKRMTRDFSATTKAAPGSCFLTEIVRDACRLKLNETISPKCQDLLMLPATALYSIPKSEQKNYTTQDPTNGLHMKVLSNPEVRLIHLWNEFFDRTPINLTEFASQNVSIHEPYMIGEIQRLVNPGPKTIRLPLSTEDDSDSMQYYVHQSMYLKQSKSRPKSDIRWKTGKYQVPQQPAAIMVSMLCPATVAASGAVL